MNMASRASIFTPIRPPAQHERFSEYEQRRQKHGGWTAEIETRGNVFYTVGRTPREAYERADDKYGRGAWRCVRLHKTKEILHV